MPPPCRCQSAPRRSMRIVHVTASPKISRLSSLPEVHGSAVYACKNCVYLCSTVLCCFGNVLVKFLCTSSNGRGPHRWRRKGKIVCLHQACARGEAAKFGNVAFELLYASARERGERAKRENLYHSTEAAHPLFWHACMPLGGPEWVAFSFTTSCTSRTVSFSSNIQRKMERDIVDNLLPQFVCQAIE